MKYKILVLVRRDNDGTYIAEVPEFKGCHTYGKTLDELHENLNDVIRLYLEKEEQAQSGPLKTPVPEVQYVEVESPLYA